MGKVADFIDKHGYTYKSFVLATIIFPPAGDLPLVVVPVPMLDPPSHGPRAEAWPSSARGWLRVQAAGNPTHCVA